MNDVAKLISLLDVVYWTHVAVQKIQEDTVTKCFIEAGFQDDTSVHDNFNEASGNMDVINNLFRQYNFPFEMDVVLQFYEDVITEYHSDIAVELITPDNCDSEPEERKEDDEAENTLCNVKISTPREALSAVNDLVDLALASNSTSLLEFWFIRPEIYLKVLWL